MVVVSRDKEKEREVEVMGKAATSRVNLRFIDLVGELERRCKVKQASNEETGSLKTGSHLLLLQPDIHLSR